MTIAERLHAYMEFERPNLQEVVDWCLRYDPQGKVKLVDKGHLTFNFTDGSYLEWIYTGRKH